MTLMKFSLSNAGALMRRDVVLQLLALAGIVALGFWLMRATGQGLGNAGISLDFGFLRSTANFPISESLIAYSPSDSYGWALVVGLINTAKVAVVGIVIMTLIGVPVGIMRCSPNRALTLFSQCYVEIIRNTPLLLQLFVWTAVVRSLPPVRQALTPLPDIYLSQRGLNVPTLVLDPALPVGWGGIAAILAGACALAIYRRRASILGWSAVVLVVALAAGLTTGDVTPSIPELKGFGIGGGGSISPEFIALTMGLSIYGSAALAETVRSGIRSVEKGQWEAARSVSLSTFQTIWLIVMPQTLRVVIPPTTSLYMNLIKNSSLAVAIGYPDIVYAANTTMNQSGQIVQVILLLMATYLIMNMMVSVFMNWYNHRVQLVTR